MRFMDARVLAIGGVRLPRNPVGLHRRGRLRDQRRRFGSGRARAAASGRCVRCICRSRRARQPADSRPDCASTARISTSRRRRSKRRWNGRCRKSAGRRRARRRISRRGRDIARARRRSAAASGRFAIARSNAGSRRRLVVCRAFRGRARRHGHIRLLRTFGGRSGRHGLCAAPAVRARDDACLPKYAATACRSR